MLGPGSGVEGLGIRVGFEGWGEDLKVSAPPSERLRGTLSKSKTTQRHFVSQSATPGDFSFMDCWEETRARVCVCDEVPAWLFLQQPQKPQQVNSSTDCCKNSFN